MLNSKEATNVLKRYGLNFNLDNDFIYSIGEIESNYNVKLYDNIYLNILLPQSGGAITELETFTDEVNPSNSIVLNWLTENDTIPNSFKVFPIKMYLKHNGYIKKIIKMELIDMYEKMLSKHMNIIIIYDNDTDIKLFNKIESDIEFSGKKIYKINKIYIPELISTRGTVPSLRAIAIPDARHFREPSAPNTTILSPITRNIFLSDIYIAQNRDILLSNNIHYVINMANNPTYIKFTEDDITYMDIKIDDSNRENISMYFEPTYNFIENGLSHGSNVLVHCQAGISRSATIVIAYIMMKYNASYEAAIEFVRSKRNFIGPNIAFIQSLINLQKSINVRITTRAELNDIL